MLVTEAWECLGDITVVGLPDSIVVSVAFKDLDFVQRDRERAFWILLQFLLLFVLSLLFRGLFE